MTLKALGVTLEERPPGQRSPGHVDLVSRRLVSSLCFVQRELDIALELGRSRPADRIFLVLVRLDECEVPSRCSHLQHSDVFEGKALTGLLR